MQFSTHLSSTVQTQQTSHSIWQGAVQAGYPAALWRLPNRTDRELIIDASGTVATVAMDFEELPMGFAVSPFVNPDAERTFFLKADFYWRFDENGTMLAAQNKLPTDHPAFESLFRTDSKTVSKEAIPIVKVIKSIQNQQLDFEEAVSRAIRQMERGTFRKVVLSRTKTIRFEEQPDIPMLFNRLCQAYPNAFVSAVYLPDRNQVWIGATPERLVSVDADGIFRTVALAGTQSAFDSEGRQKRTADAPWTQKEIEEQALVGRYIIGCFKKIRVREYIEEGPRTVVAGNLMHLRSDYSVDTQAVNFPQLGTVMLRLLHPTSAVCGMPRETAQAFILQHEAHERELYSGFLGPVNIARQKGPETDLFVNLRCMKLEGQEGTLYAGAGLTEDSSPAKEWRETELKCDTMLSVITQ
ncbi:isochorismate synthase [Larkinella humicola]|uniref:isochorismate synthase n=1 Tax=Larkinella humicola TaxID=2607654 RepID=A0A5N1JAK4_9BACT|nr:isochorismate synthase [Larkinella humicola]KAA9349435.1 isochorismate synthase [Larkinella humicola]